MHIRLCMIVRDESAVIERCLKSVLPHVHSAVIVDTGSTDDTVAKITQLFGDTPCLLPQRPWKNHAHNRTEAFHIAREAFNVKPDYIFWLDAKDVVLSWPTELPETPQFGFNVMVRYGNLEYDRPALLRPLAGFAWSQGVHEALLYDGAGKVYPRLTDLVVEPQGGQASSSDDGKFQKQVQILQEEFTSTKSTRAAYYLAQAHRDCGQLEDAYRWYLERAGMTHGWVEETWSARLEAAKVAERLDRPFNEVLGGYLLAHQLRPARAESLYHAARYCRLRSQFHLSKVFAEAAAKIPRPADSLFIEFGVYSWLAKEEAALAAWFSGDQETARAWISQIDVDKITVPTERARVSNNRIQMGLAQ